MTPALLRARLEAALGDRFPAALSPGERLAPDLVSTGVPAIDALAAGLPRGALTEICGPASSGRTSLLLAVLAEATRRNEACALVDAGDAFDPHSAAVAGVELGRLLWVRCGNRVIGPSGHRVISEDQIARSPSHPITKCLDQALRAADLLLQAGGFGLVAIDLGDVAPTLARRVPLTSWFRFRRAVERTPTVLLLVDQEPCARSCASLVLQLQSPVASIQPPVNIEMPTHARLLQGISASVEVLRSRAERKPVSAVPASFHSQAVWDGRTG
jgi:recombination protein RecA